MFKLFSFSCFSSFLTYGVFSPKKKKTQLKSRLNVKQMQPPTAFQGQHQNVTRMWMLLKDKTRTQNKSFNVLGAKRDD